MIWKQKIVTNRLARYLKDGGKAPGPSQKEKKDMTSKGQKISERYPTGTHLRVGVDHGDSVFTLSKNAISLGAETPDGRLLCQQLDGNDGGDYCFTDEDMVIKVYEKRSDEEVKELMRQWETDPNWDIEETEGFEAHYIQLRMFRKETEERWEKEYKEREEAEARSWGLSDHPALYRKMKSMHDTILRLQNEVDRLKDEVDSR